MNERKRDGCPVRQTVRRCQTGPLRRAGGQLSPKLHLRQLPPTPNASMLRCGCGHFWPPQMLLRQLPACIRSMRSSALLLVRQTGLTPSLSTCMAMCFATY
eukprot:2542014-Amphidinium_carterae.1